MAFKKEIYFALDIGSHSMRLFAARPVEDDFEIVGYKSVDSEGIFRGEVISLKDASLALSNLKNEMMEGLDMEIDSVYLAINSPKIRSSNEILSISLGEMREIKERDIQTLETEELERNDSQALKDYVVIKKIAQNYLIDDKTYPDVLGLSSDKLAMGIHYVEGPKSLSNELPHLLKEVKLECKELVFSPLAMSQAFGDVKNGLFIDIGKTYTGYLLKDSGIPIASGCIPVGGDHITNDISVITKMKFYDAEKLKKEEVNLEEFSSKKNSPSQIAFFRMKELFEIIRSQVNISFQNLSNHQIGSIPKTSVYLAGGSSQIKGIDFLAKSIFGGECSIFQSENLNSSDAVVLGLLYYISKQNLQFENKSLFSKFISNIKDSF